MSDKLCEMTKKISDVVPPERNEPISRFDLQHEHEYHVSIVQTGGAQSQNRIVMVCRCGDVISVKPREVEAK